MLYTRIASRLEYFLPKLIQEGQNGFFIVSENVRLMNEILCATKYQEIPGLLLSMDFQ